MLLAVGTLFPLRFSFLSLLCLEITEQKSGYILQTVLLEGRKQRTICESQNRGEQETVSGVQIHQNSELYGFWENICVM